MLYDSILIDVSNFFYRVKGKENNVGCVTNIMIDKTLETKSRLKKDGRLFLLYDPMPTNDLGVSKVFKYDNNRKTENPDYKSGRKFSPLFTECINQYQKYFLYRGDNIVSVYSDQYEADDYVETIVQELKKTPKTKVALMTTDHDYARYLTLGIDMINKDWDHPYTREAFLKDYDFYPSVASVTLFKAIYGDSSDNIKGAITLKKSLEMIRNSANDAIKYLGENDMLIDNLIKEFTVPVSINIIDMAADSPIKALVANIISMDLNSLVIDQILANINLIRSRCSSYIKYAHTNPENTVLNSILEESLGRIKNKKSFKFGLKVKK
jgi:5'-3' exonuclease